MIDDLTVIYYTANREKPEFEEKTKKLILDTIKDTPLISVSHKPIDFGKNIWVGDVGCSGHNVFRQFQIGALEAKTKYVCPCESDFLYPPEYFTFKRPKDDIFYLIMPLYVLFAQRGMKKYFAKKERGSEACMVVNRDHLLKRMDAMFKGHDMWGPVEEIIWLLRGCARELVFIDKPIITFKTDNNMHRRTPHDVKDRLLDLPYWGNAHELIKEYLE